MRSGMFARRTHWKTRLNRLTKQLRRLEAAGHNILDLTESNPTRCQFQYPPEITSALNNPENLNYAPSPKGMLCSREAVVAYYSERGVSLDPEQIFLTASTSEAYSLLFKLLADAGDDGSRDVVVVNFPTIQYDHTSPDKYRLPLDTEQLPVKLGPEWRGW